MHNAWDKGYVAATLEIQDGDIVEPDGSRPPAWKAGDSL